MPSQHLSNHVRKFRKRSALSQRDVAFLLGAKCASKICRYERFVREPGFATAVACEAIFRRPVSELFPGVYHKIAAGVRTRAKTLLEKERHGKPNRVAARRRETLAAIVSGEFDSQLKRQ